MNARAVQTRVETLTVAKDLLRYSAIYVIIIFFMMNKTVRS